MFVFGRLKSYLSDLLKRSAAQQEALETQAEYLKELVSCSHRHEQHMKALVQGLNNQSAMLSTHLQAMTGELRGLNRRLSEIAPWLDEQVGGASDAGELARRLHQLDGLMGQSVHMLENISSTQRAQIVLMRDQCEAVETLGRKVKSGASANGAHSDSATTG